MREVQGEARGDFHDLVGVGLFRPLGTSLAQDVEHQGSSGDGFNVYARAAGFLHRAGIDCDRGEIVRRFLSTSLPDEIPNREQIGGVDWWRFPFGRF